MKSEAYITWQPYKFISDPLPDPRCINYDGPIAPIDTRVPGTYLQEAARLTTYIIFEAMLKSRNL